MHGLPALRPATFAGRRWLELALDHRCNLRCLGCRSCHDGPDTKQRLTTRDAAAWLRAGREHGVDRLWLGGGEPTLRDDLLVIVREARRVGYRDVVVQTNGVRLAYPKYRDALVAAGVTEIRFNVKSHRAEIHDRLSGGVACHEHLLTAIAGLAEAAPVALAADVLLTRGTAGEMAPLVTFFAERGVRAFVLWLLSASDSEDARVAGEIPRISDIGPALGAALAEAQRCGATLASLHTPPCTLPPLLRGIFSPASELGLLVVGPDARPFPLETSPFEGGAYLPACAGCNARPSCGGPRADYLAVHGDAEFAALPAP